MRSWPPACRGAGSGWSRGGAVAYDLMPTESRRVEILIGS